MTPSEPRPIELHYWTTPNGHKITIMLEELGVPYELHFVNIGKGGGHQAWHHVIDALGMGDGEGVVVQNVANAVFSQAADPDEIQRVAAQSPGAGLGDTIDVFGLLGHRPGTEACW